MPSTQEQEEGAESDGSITWEDFFGTTTAEDLVPTLLSMYDTLVGRPGVAVESGVRRPSEPPPLPPPITRPLSVTSIASFSSSSSSSVNSSCSGRRRLPSKAYLASIESLEDSEDEIQPCGTSNAGSQGSQDSGVCSPCSHISSPSPPHTKPKYCDPHLSYMDRVVMEIIETECVYVNDLKQVIVGYIETWENCSDCILNDDQMSDLFGNLRQIYSFNSLFLKELEECGLDPFKVAKVFVNNNNGFSIYTDYCTNYPRTVRVLTELMRQECTARLFRERQSSLQHTLPLGSYLLKPVQRILKYHLLLQNIVKNLTANVNGYSDVVDALSTMTAIAHHINDMKRKHEHAVRVQEIQSLLLGWNGEDLTTFGELCAEGTFRMSGAKALRHAFLFDQILLITKKKEDGILGYKAHIMCSNLMLIESVTGEPLSFHVIPFDNPRFQYTLQARSLEQKREWTLQLKRVILENYNAVIPSHARQLVMQLGQNRTEDEILAEKTAPKRQHSAPEYLKRRKLERERRKSETGLRARLRTRNRKSDTQPYIKSNVQHRLKRASLVKEDDINKGMSEGEMTELESETLAESTYESGSVDTSVTEDFCDPPSQVEKKKTIEEIVSQLLMQNKEFQRVLKKQRHITRRHKIETDEEDEGCNSISTSRSSQSLSLQREGDYDNLQNVWEEVKGLEFDSLKRAQSFTSQGEYEECLSETSLSGSISCDGPTSPAVWLKQQRQHLVIPTSNKAGSLPRGFQLGTPDWHRARISPDRPFTIASDKAQELNLEDMQRYCESHDKLTRNRFPLPDDTTEDDITPDASTQNLHVHPEHKIYRPSLTKATLKQVISSVSNKLASIRLSSEALDEIDESKNKLITFAKTFAKKKEEKYQPVYKLGSCALGARIAHGNETSDYADPRTLFPNITKSKKAAALLGIRPYSVLSLVSNLTLTSNEETLKSQTEEVETVESDGSADSFYERSFEAIESTMTNDVCRDSAIFSEHEDIVEQFLSKPRPHKKIPPPVPSKPPALRTWRTPQNETPNNTFRKKDNNSISSHPNSPDVSAKGWVKHVIGKIQGDQNN